MLLLMLQLNHGPQGGELGGNEGGNKLQLVLVIGDSLGHVAGYLQQCRVALEISSYHFIELLKNGVISSNVVDNHRLFSSMVKILIWSYPA